MVFQRRWAFLLTVAAAASINLGWARHLATANGDPSGEGDQGTVAVPGRLAPKPGPQAGFVISNSDLPDEISSDELNQIDVCFLSSVRAHLVEKAKLRGKAALAEHSAAAHESTINDIPVVTVTSAARNQIERRVLILLTKRESLVSTPWAEVPLAASLAAQTGMDIIIVDYGPASQESFSSVSEVVESIYRRRLISPEKT